MFERFKRRKPEPVFKADVAEIESFKTMLKGEKCPGCNQTGLSLRNYERGPKGFEAKVVCDNCSVYGTVNTTGFNFQRLGLKKGEAREMPMVMR